MEMSIEIVGGDPADPVRQSLERYAEETDLRDVALSIFRIVDANPDESAEVLDAVARQVDDLIEACGSEAGVDLLNAIRGLLLALHAVAMGIPEYR
jgi:hypothetical protein